MNKKTSNTLSLGYKLTCLFLTLILSTVANLVNAQTTLYSLGAKLLSEAEYEQLPKVNWSVLRSNATKRAIAIKSSGIVMLNNPPIGSQGAQGSCVAWAVGYAATSILAYPKFNNWDNAKRSPSYIYNQIKIDPTDCNSGTYTTSGLNLVKNQGVCSYTLMPYVNDDCVTLPNNIQRFDASLNTVLNWGTLSRNDVSGIKQALDLGYPVVVAYRVYQSFYSMWSSGGVWSSPSTGTSNSSHAVCIVGYDDTQQMFKVQNSWGTSGGDNGYFWVTYNLVQNNCLSEVYVLSEINQSIYPTISGNTNVCPGSTISFTVSNAPSGYTWGYSGNLTPVSGQPSYFKVADELLSTVSRSAWVSINHNGVELARKSVTVKRKMYINGPTSIKTSGTHTFSVYTDCPNLNDEYSWVLTNRYGMETQEKVGSSIEISAVAMEYYDPSTTLYILDLKRNGRPVHFLDFGVLRYYLSIKGIKVPFQPHDPYAPPIIFYASPNPTATSLRIAKTSATTQQGSLLSQRSTTLTTYLARLISIQTGAVVLEQTVSGDSFDLNVSGVLNGNYTLVLSQEGSVVWSSNVIVQH